MGGVAFRSRTSCALPSGRLRRFAASWPKPCASSALATRLRFDSPLKKKKPPCRTVLSFLEMGGVDPPLGPFPGPPSGPGQPLTRPSVAAFPRLRSARLPVRHPPIPLSKRKAARRRPFVFWRWGESNPRPEVRHRGVYRFIGARWLSGAGGSAASVGSLSVKMSLLPLRPKSR